MRQRLKTLATVILVGLFGILLAGKTSADDQPLTTIKQESNKELQASLEAESTIGRESATETMSIADQRAIIEEYLYMTGQTKHRPDHMSLSVETGLPIKCGTPSIVRFQANYDKFDKNLLQSLGVAELPRPSLNAFFDSPDGHFRIHYSTFGIDTVYRASTDINGNSVPDYIDSVAMIADSVWDIMINQMGFPAPVVDTICTTGDGPRFDIYVSDLTTNIFGRTWADIDCFVTGSLLMQVPAFIEIDNDYVHVPTYRDRPMDAVRVTVAHEFFHAIQFGMDWTEFTGGVPRGGTYSGNLYWAEMSSTWMEEHLYDEINDYYFYLPFFFSVPNASFQQFLSGADLHPYGSVIFPIFLSEKYGDDIIRLIWEKETALGVGPHFLEATAFVIDSLTNGIESYVSAYSEFALWNYFTNFRLPLAPPGMAYEEALDYPFFPDEKTAVFDSFPVDLVPANENIFKPEHNAVSIYRFENTQLVQEDRLYRCDLDDNGYKNNPCDTSQFILTVEVFDSTEIWDYKDSSFSILMAPEGMRVIEGTDTILTDWSVSLIFQDTLDAIEIDQLYLPSINCSKEICLPAYILEIDSINRFKRITAIVAPASPFEELYVERKGRRLAYAVREIMSGDTATTIQQGFELVKQPLIIYPNPAVVNNMTYEVVGFRLDSLEVFGDLGGSGFPTMRVRTVLNVFDLAGNIVYSVDTTSAWDWRNFTLFRKVPLEVSWDMKNQSGVPVASGIYVGVAEVYINRQKMAQGTGKVAIIR